MTKITTVISSVKYYNQNMKDFINAIFPAEFKRNIAYWRGFVLGLVFLILAVTQLFKFEDFPDLISAMHLRDFGAVPWVLAIIFPLLEIASLPYLISMRVPATVREYSKWSGLAVTILWLGLTIWTSVYMGGAVESGLFGGTVGTNSGWWSVLFAALLLWSYILTIRELPRRRAA